MISRDLAKRLGVHCVLSRSACAICLLLAQELDYFDAHHSAATSFTDGLHGRIDALVEDGAKKRNVCQTEHWFKDRTTTDAV